jgi:ankyrin repeat protein
MRASFHGYPDLAAILIRLGADINLHDKIGKTALHYAAQEKREQIVRILIEAGADVNSQDIHGNSPLGDAVFYARDSGAVIRILRKNGADDNLPNKHGVSPLGLAKSVANYDLLQYFQD